MNVAAEAAAWFIPWLVIVGLAVTIDPVARARRRRVRARARARREHRRALRAFGTIQAPYRVKPLDRSS